MSDLDDASGESGRTCFAVCVKARQAIFDNYYILRVIDTSQKSEQRFKINRYIWRGNIRGTETWNGNDVEVTISREGDLIPFDETFKCILIFVTCRVYICTGRM